MFLRRTAMLTRVPLATTRLLSVMLIGAMTFSATVSSTWFPGLGTSAHAQMIETTSLKAGTSSAAMEDDQIRERVLELMDKRMRELRRELSKELDELLSLRTAERQMRERIEALQAENARLKEALRMGQTPAPAPAGGPSTGVVVGSAFLGVGTSAPSPEIAEKIGSAPERCLLVTEVVKDSPAAAIGLRVGDVIVEIGGQPASRENFQRELGGKSPRDPISLRYFQLGGTSPVRVDARAELANRADFAAAIAPDQTRRVPSPPAPPPVAVTPTPVPPAPVKPVPSEQKVRLGLTLEEVAVGKLITIEVADGGNAAVAGMKAGDQLLQLGETKVATLDDVRKVVADWRVGREARFVYMRDQSTKEFIVALGGDTVAPRIVKQVVNVGETPPAPAAPITFGVMVEAEGAAGSGLRVLEVVAGSNAAVAGLQVDDRVIKIDEQAIATVDDLRAALALWRVGRVANIEFHRGASKMHASIEVGTAGGPSPRLIKSGAKLTTETPRKRVPPFLGVRLDQGDGGLLIIEVIAGTSAEAMGMRANDLLTGINGAVVQSQDDLRKIMSGLAAGDSVTIAVKRAGTHLELSGTLKAREGTAGAPPAEPGAPSPNSDDPVGAAQPMPAASLIPSVGVVRPVAAGTTVPAPLGRPFVGFELEEALAGGAVRIVGVDADGPAATAGLRVGDRLLQLDGSPGVGLDTLRETLSRRRPGDLLVLLVERDTKTLEVTVVLGAR